MFAYLKKVMRGYEKNFAPKLYEVLKQGYNKEYFKRDAVAGMTVAVISIPLALALAIASGVEPAQGLYTAIVAGFFIAFLGGSRYQIGGPTGAFVVVIFNVMAQYGYTGLAMVMVMAGVILMLAGLLRLGTYIKYIPYPVVLGFTAGIGLLLISTQIKDLLGLNIENVPAEFLPKWKTYLANMDKFSWGSVVITILSLGCIFYIQIKKIKVPAYLVSVAGATILVLIFSLFGLNVDTIGSKFGGIPHFLPAPAFPEFNLETALKVMPSAFTIAFLAGVESLQFQCRTHWRRDCQHRICFLYGRPCDRSHCPHGHKLQIQSLFAGCRHDAECFSAVIYAFIITCCPIYSAGLPVCRFGYYRLEYVEFG